MDNEIKEKWVAALRSGKYTQGFGVLRSKGDGFCCLGVLCDVVDPSQWRESKDFSTYSYLDSDALLPEEVREKVKIPRPFGTVLTRMNDKGQNSFLEIADWIEENL